MRTKLMLTCWLIAVTGTVLFPLGAFAQAQEAGTVTRSSDDQPLLHHRLSLDGGLYSALGFGGVTFAYSPVSSFLVEGGLGFGLSGIQVSLMPKLSVGGPHHRFVTGAGVALAVPVQGSLIDSTGLWANLDLAGYEYRATSGLSFAVSAGVSIGVAGGGTCGFFDEWCGDEGDQRMKGMVLPQGRVSVGYWF